MQPAPLPPQKKSRRSYFLGLGLGFIPLIPLLIGTGFNLLPAPTESASLNHAVLFLYCFFVALGLDVIVLIATIVCLCIKRVRWVGYGLLTAFLVTPVVTYVGCIVIINRPH